MAKQFYSTGPGSECFKEIDAFMETYMKQYDINGGALAISKDGHLVHAKGYNWAEPGGVPIMPTTIFRIASISKIITGLMIHKLIEDSNGKYTLDSLVWDILPYKNLPLPKFKFDEKPKDLDMPGKYFNAVSIRHLLSHEGGWGHDGSDPTFKHDQEIANYSQGGKLPIDKLRILFWSILVQGQIYYPREGKRGYSNFGYLVLGYVIESITGMGYIEAVKKHLLTPLGITRPQQAGTTEAERKENEASYFRNPPLQTPCVTGKGGMCAEQYGSENIHNFDSFGGWVLSPPDYVKILAEYRSKNPVMPKVGPENLITWLAKPTNLSTKGIVYDHDGMLPGTWSYAARRSDGVDFMVVWNTTSNKENFVYKGEPYSTRQHDVIWHRLLDAITVWPSLDLNPAYFATSIGGTNTNLKRYDGVWNAMTEKRLMYHGKTATEFQQLYGKSYDNGMKLVFQEVYWQRSSEMWDGIWAPNTNGQFVSWGATYEGFGKQYKEQWDKGFRLVHQQAFVKNGQTLYNGIWNPSSDGQFVSWDKTLSQFHQQYDEMWKKGFRLIHQQCYVKNGQLFYNGIWNPSQAAQFVTWEKTLPDFSKQYDEHWKAGFRLIQCQAVNLNGILLYNGIWDPSTSGQYISWNKDSEIIEAENITMQSGGFQPIMLAAY